jgi:hypothetical protein
MRRADTQRSGGVFDADQDIPHLPVARCRDPRPLLAQCRNRTRATRVPHRNPLSSRARAVRVGDRSRVTGRPVGPIRSRGEDQKLSPGRNARARVSARCVLRPPAVNLRHLHLDSPPHTSPSAQLCARWRGNLLRPRWRRRRNDSRAPGIRAARSRPRRRRGRLRRHWR